MARKNKIMACPCGSSLSYSQCCEQYHSGGNYPQSAEQLMRSRYSAYYYENENYLKLTWLSSSCPQPLSLTPTKWTGLKIISTQKGQEYDNEGWVEFEAKYKVNGKAEKMHERSYFVRENGKWVYAKAS